MLLTRKNIHGGKPVKGFPIREYNGHLGYFVGYCDCGCNEPILMNLQDREMLIAAFHVGDEMLEKVKQIITQKISLKQQFREWLIRQLGGAVASSQMTVDNLY